MAYQTVLLAWVNTLICCLGLLKRPRSGYELFRPRFAVPALLWLTMVVPVFLYAFVQVDSELDKVTSSREQAQVAAMQFFAACMLLFWLGYWLPLGRAIAAPLTSVSLDFRVNPRPFRRLTYIAGLGTAVGLVVVVGSQLWGGAASHRNLDGSVITVLIGRALQLSSPLLGAMVGLSWPVKGERHPLNVTALVLVLFTASVPLMMTFSRGTGLPVLVAVIAYTFRTKRLHVWTCLALVVWLSVASHAGIHGRSVHGHYAGLLPYLHFLVSESIWSVGASFLNLLLASDFFTPLCVSIHAEQLEHLGRLSPVDWLKFQLPVPRGLGVHPDWTFTLTYYLGGRGSWNYTCGIFGDAYIHLGPVFGAAMFAVVGVFYRFVDRLAFGQEQGELPGQGERNTISAHSVLVLLSYFAMIYGVFNNFRSWVTLSALATYFMLALVSLRFFLQPAATAPAPADPAGDGWVPSPDLKRG